MNSIWKQIGLAAVMGLLLPAMVLAFATRSRPETGETTAAPAPAVPSGTTAPSAASDLTVPVLGKDGTVTDMDLNTYLVGVVLAEMPADFEPEAHKAQAVVARTYAMKRRTGSKHPGGAVCTDPACCQGYLSPEDYVNRGGSAETVEEIRRQVLATGDTVLTYQGALIDATYFSCSGGRTEDALAVWGTDVPYLQSTDSPGEENAAHNTDTVTFTGEAFAAALGEELVGSPETWLGDVTYTEGGGVATMVIGAETYTGTELRQMLGLRSTVFSMTAQDNTVTVVTHGFGHRVGMSQYGADAMAASGSSYEEILAHYYQGTALESAVRFAA